MTSNRKDKIRALLKGIETGDAAATAVVSPDKYIQHNPQTHEGGEGLAALFTRLAKTEPRVRIVRIFEDGDYVFAHTEYDFATQRTGFEIFRFEGELTVEHWDNIQSRQGPNPSGHSMTDGPTEATDLHKTETNREIVGSFVEEVLISRRLDELENFIDGERYTQHNPFLADGPAALRSVLERASGEEPAIVYDRSHRLLVEGNFALSACEGYFGGVHSAFYDLYRVDRGKLVEQWNTIEAISPREVWKNENGKF